jgi:exodeoxyribonuclease VII small subunit
VTDANPDATNDAPTTPPDLPADVAALSYEEARDELVEVVARLEAGSEPLEASLALWERGEALAARCQQWLDGARQRLAAAQAGATVGAGTDTGTGTGTDTDEDLA